MSQEVCHATTRNHSSEFKRKAVELTRMEGVKISQIARDLGIRANMLGRWRRELSADGEKAFQGQGKVREEEMARLTRELAKVKNEIPHDRALPRCLSHTPDVSEPGHIAEWLL